MVFCQSCFKQVRSTSSFQFVQAERRTHAFEAYLFRRLAHTSDCLYQMTKSVILQNYVTYEHQNVLRVLLKHSLASFKADFFLLKKRKKGSTYFAPYVFHSFFSESEAILEPYPRVFASYLKLPASDSLLFRSRN